MPGGDSALGHMQTRSAALTSPAPHPNSGPCPSGTSKSKISEQNPDFWPFLQTRKILEPDLRLVIDISGTHVPPLGHGDSDSAGVHRELGSTKTTLTAALVFTAQSGNNPHVRQPTGKWGNRTRYTYTEYCSATRRNEVRTDAMMWMGLENIMLGERRQMQNLKRPQQRNPER